MKRVGEARTYREQIDYHLADGRAPWFVDTQRGRVDLARFLVNKVVEAVGHIRRIVELGCGAGDISGPHSLTSEVIGVDVTQAAAIACGERWPEMTFLLSPVEELNPVACDLLILTEFLEHVDNPVAIVQSWLPLARWAVIGHPLDEPDPPIEPGHIWSYTREDWRRWFALGHHEWLEEFRFPMGGWDAMILGHSKRKDG